MRHVLILSALCLMATGCGGKDRTTSTNDTDMGETESSDSAGSADSSPDPSSEGSAGEAGGEEDSSDTSTNDAGVTTDMGGAEDTGTETDTDTDTTDGDSGPTAVLEVYLNHSDGGFSILDDQDMEVDMLTAEDCGPMLPNDYHVCELEMAHGDYQVVPTDVAGWLTPDPVPFTLNSLGGLIFLDYQEPPDVGDTDTN